MEYKQPHIFVLHQPDFETSRDYQDQRPRYSDQNDVRRSGYGNRGFTAITVLSTTVTIAATSLLATKSQMKILGFYFITHKARIAEVKRLTLESDVLRRICRKCRTSPRPWSCTAGSGRKELCSLLEEDEPESKKSKLVLVDATNWKFQRS